MHHTLSSLCSKNLACLCREYNIIISPYFKSLQCSKDDHLAPAEMLCVHHRLTQPDTTVPAPTQRSSSPLPLEEAGAFALSPLSSMPPD